MYQHQISVLLGRTGSNICYKGHLLCITALDWMLVSGRRHFHITKDIYPVIAQAHHTSIKNVERNIRTLIAVCWHNGDQELIQRLCRRKHKPSNGEFLAGMYAYLSRQISLAEEAERQALAAASGKTPKK